MAINCDGCPLEKKRNALPLALSKAKPYTIVTKPPTIYDTRHGNVLPGSYGDVLRNALNANGMRLDKDFNIVPSIRCAYEADTYTTKDKRAIKKICRANLAETLTNLESDVIIPLGADATSAVAGRAVKISKVRGIPSDNEEFETIVLPILDPAIVKVRVENTPLFNSDIGSFVRLVDNDLKAPVEGELWGDYTFIDDIGFIVEANPDILGLDTETMGFNYHYEDQKLLTIQFCYEEGKAYTLSWDHPDSILSDAKKKKVIKDLRTLVRNKVEFTCSNGKFDTLWIYKKLGVDVPIGHDTVLLYSLLNENSRSKSLAVLTKIYVPRLAGYSDIFDAEIDKAHMEEVKLGDMLNYASADADAVFTLTTILLDDLWEDQALWNYYNRVTIPGINAFKEMEKDGILIDESKLQNFRGMLSSKVHELRESLLNRVPRSIRRKHIPKGLAFTRADFIRDILFNHPDGFRFKPQVFTESTKNLPDKKMRLASTSTKQHLPYFIPHPFVEDLIEYIKLERMLGTNVVSFEKKYVHPDGMIHPAHSMSTAVTGRVSSVAPNAQNFPSRGDLAKPYKEMLNAPQGSCMVAADLSQAELRVIAHEANETTMIDIYRNGGDIHARTAAEVMSLSLDEFYNLAPKVIGEKRFGAKGVNFGFVYGLLAKSYVSYAKTQYGITVTLKESEIIRDRYFRTYNRLPAWHRRREAEVIENKQVRSLFGRLRHLPQIDSDDFFTKIEAVRQAINSGIQGVGSDLGVISLARITSEIDKRYLYPRQFIHDAIYCYVPKQYAAWGSIALKYYMESNNLKEMFGVDFAVPIVADPEIGTSQGTLVEVPKAPFIHIDNITEQSISYLDEYIDSLTEKGLVLPKQEIPPHSGRKFLPRRRR